VTCAAAPSSNSSGSQIPRTDQGAQYAHGATKPGIQYGFIELINLLLGQQQTAQEPGGITGDNCQPDEAAEADRALWNEVRHSDTAMAATRHDESGLSGLFGTRAHSKAAGKKLLSTDQIGLDSSTTSAPVVPNAVPPSAQNTLTETLRGNPNGLGASINGVELQSGRFKQHSQAPIAFALKLTSKEDQPQQDGPDAASRAHGEQSSSTEPSAETGETKADESVSGNPPNTPESSDSKRQGLGPSAQANMLGTKIMEGIPFSSETGPISSTSTTEPTARPAAQTPTGALRIEAAAPVVPPSSPSPLQEISVRINRAEQAVDVHVAERGGQVHVSVRTPDSDLQTSLRQDLGTLVRSLARAGFHADAVAPNSGPGTPPSAAVLNGAGSQHRNSDSNSSRNSGEQSGHQQQPGQHRQNSKKWAEELEDAQ
jgi:hypothetical protein